MKRGPQVDKLGDLVRRADPMHLSRVADSWAEVVEALTMTHRQLERSVARISSTLGGQGAQAAVQRMAEVSASTQERAQRIERGRSSLVDTAAALAEARTVFENSGGNIDADYSGPERPGEVRGYIIDANSSEEIIWRAHERARRRGEADTFAEQEQRAAVQNAKLEAALTDTSMQMEHIRSVDEPRHSTPVSPPVPRPEEPGLRPPRTPVGEPPVATTPSLPPTAPPTVTPTPVATPDWGTAQSAVAAPPAPPVVPGPTPGAPVAPIGGGTPVAGAALLGTGTTATGVGTPRASLSSAGVRGIGSTGSAGSTTPGAAARSGSGAGSAGARAGGAPASRAGGRGGAGGAAGRGAGSRHAGGARGQLGAGRVGTKRDEDDDAPVWELEDASADDWVGEDDAAPSVIR